MSDPLDNLIRMKKEECPYWNLCYSELRLEIIGDCLKPSHIECKNYKKMEEMFECKK